MQKLSFKNSIFNSSHKSYKPTLCALNAFANPGIICSSNITIILYITCAESKAVGRAQQVHPLQDACRKLQEGADTRPVTLHKERAEMWEGPTRPLPQGPAGVIKITPYSGTVTTLQELTLLSVAERKSNFTYPILHSPDRRCSPIHWRWKVPQRSQS